MVEGEKNILELLNADYKIKRLLTTKDFLRKYEKSIDSLPYAEVTVKELADVSSLVTNNQSLAVVEMKSFSIKDLDLSGHLFVLDGIRDPGNLGTIIRTIDWFGFNQLVCSEDTVELYNPKTINATKGSFVRIKTVYCDLEEFIINYDGMKIGAEMTGTRIDEYRNTKPSMIIMGSESHGITKSVKAHLDQSVSIPKLGGAESLNVGVAIGILCHVLTSK